MRVAIIGAGIGGLTTALRLHHDGIDCVVHEQSEQIHEVGIGINMLPYAVKELAALGLLAPLVEAGIRTRELFYTHRLGPVILRKPCGLDAGFDLPQLSFHRGRLQGVLLRAVLERLGENAVVAGHRLTGFEQDSDGVIAHLVDRQGNAWDPVRADVLVAADGIHSTVRSLLFPDEGPPRWNGVTMWRGATDWPRFGTGASMLIAGGTAAKLVVYPIGAGRTPDTRLTNWAVCVLTGQDGSPPPQRQDWARPAARAEFADHLGLFQTPMVDHVGLVAATEECFEFPMCDRDPLPFWSQGRVTLLGDAAHPMYPRGANGGAQAILDARALADALKADADPVEALKAYEAKRLPATSEVVLANRRAPPDAILHEVYRRTGDKPFKSIDDVISREELVALSESYKRVAGYDKERLKAAQ